MKIFPPLSGAVVLLAAAAAAAAPLPDLARAETMVLESTNAFRRQQSVDPVALDPTLESAAREFARFMARSDKYGHEADGRQPADRARRQGYDYCVISENIAYQYDSGGFETSRLAESLFEGWKRSAGHRRNMLDADVTQAAVAIARSEKTGRYYAVQLFASPRASCAHLRHRG